MKAIGPILATLLILGFVGFVIYTLSDVSQEKLDQIEVWTKEYPELIDTVKQFYGSEKSISNQDYWSIEGRLEKIKSDIWLKDLSTTKPKG